MNVNGALNQLKELPGLLEVDGEVVSVRVKHFVGSFSLNRLCGFLVFFQGVRSFGYKIIQP